MNVDDVKRLGDKSYFDEWSEDDIWLVFSSILSRRAPLPHMEARLEEYRATGMDVILEVKEEHCFSIGRYYRNDTGRPIVNPANIDHLTRLLYIFMRRLRIAGAPQFFLDMLFFIMRDTCGIHLFYDTVVEKFFFPQHASGSVLGYTEVGPYFQMTQNCAIGQNHGQYPELGHSVYMAPSSSILGKCKIGDNVLLATGAKVIDTDIPSNTMVFGQGRNIVLKENKNDNRTGFFDMEMLAEKLSAR